MEYQILQLLLVFLMILDTGTSCRYTSNIYVNLWREKIIMTIAVGLSGGVDSSTAAALLKEQGHDVIGVTMTHAQEIPALETYAGSACFGGNEEEDVREAEAAAKAIGIPFYVVDLSKEYKEIVLEYFTSEYLRGRTPNPCVRCNQRIKFDLLVKAFSTEIPFDRFATGHYARIRKDDQAKRMILTRARDRKKDQSYFLSQLRQHQLEQVIFPLGELTKEEVRGAARRFGLPSSEKEESQDFYAGDYRDLFDTLPPEGDLVDMDGNVLGTHAGIISYTIGQRRGLGISSPVPLYVVRIDKERNQVVVGPREALMKQTLAAQEVNWFYDHTRMDFPFPVTAQVRHGNSAHPASLIPRDDGSWLVCFDKPLAAITPGQAVVCYRGDDVVCGGYINDSLDNYPVQEADSAIQ